MQRFILIILVALFMLGCGKEEKTYYDNLGNHIKLSELHDKWLIVSYWASWCPSCRKDMPEINNFYEHNRDKLIVLGVNFDADAEEDVKQSVENLHVAFPVLTADPGAEWGMSEVTAIPTIFIISPKGKVIKKIVGEVTEEKLAVTLKDLAHYCV